jgi:D-hydroxyproline dehydrogenase subunit beta
MSMKFDVAIVGAGIVGLAHALAAQQRGLSAVVIERSAAATGASIRNFGFVTITGQRRGSTWARARRSAEIWKSLAEPAAIPLLQHGLLLLARRAEAMPILEAFLRTEMGEDCALLSAAEARARVPSLKGELIGALWSSRDLRVESREAIPALAAHLARQGVAFLWSHAVLRVEPGLVETARGAISAGTVIVCPGDDLASLFPDRIAQKGVMRCQLQMMRLEPPGFRFGSPVMTDLSLVRYRGFADLPEGAMLRARLEQEQAAHLAAGVHLIVTQSADGSLLVGDSHVYGPNPAPFAADSVDRLILSEYEALFGSAPAVRERWMGTYASGSDDAFIDAPCDGVRLVMVTSGTGASTAFALAEETLSDLYGAAS